jgi:hypothetical protein
MRGRDRVEVASMGIGGDERLVGGDGARGRLDPHLAVDRFDGGNGRFLMQQSPCRAGHARGPDDQLERMDMARPRIPHSAEIARRADPPRRLFGIHEAHMRIADPVGQIVAIGPVVRDVALLVGHREMTGLVVDLDLVGFCEFVQMRLRLLGQIEQRLGPRPAEFLFELVDTGALARVHLSAIAAGGAIAEPVLLEQHDACACLRKMSRSRKAGEPAPHDGNVGLNVAFESGVGRPFAHRILVPGDAGGNRGLVAHGEKPPSTLT